MPIRLLRQICRFVGVFALLTAAAGARPATPPLYASALASHPEAAVALQATWLPNQSLKASAVAAGDINGDGRLDALFSYDNSNTVGGYFDGGIRLFLNQGGRPSVIPDWEAHLALSIRDIGLGDMNGDGWLDVVAASYKGPLLIYLNQAGQLPSAPTWQSAGNHNAWSLALGDMDGDSDLDVVIARYAQTALIYSNLGAGALDQEPSWQSVDALRPVYVALADYDGDRDLDAAFTGYGLNTTTKVYRNEGGTLAGAPAWETVDRGWMSSVVWKNVDADPYPELFVATEHHAGDDQPNRLYDNISGTLVLTPTWSALAPSETQDLVAGDIDGDQDMDLLTVNGNIGNSRGHMEVYLQNEGTYSATPDWISSESDISYSLALADMDNDGDLDVLRANIDTPSRMYVNKQAPFADAPSWTPGDPSSSRSMAWGDYDGDGFNDLAEGTAQGVRVYRNTGSGPAALPIWQSRNDLNVYDVVWADMDMDGDLDLIAGSEVGVYMYANEGGDSFGPGPAWQDVRYGSAYMSVAVADADGDGDLDIALGTLQQPIRILGNIAVEERERGRPPLINSIATRDAWASPAGDLNIRGLAWADVDRDGDQDLAVANDGRPAQVYRNDGLTSAPGADPRLDFGLLWQNDSYFDRTRDVIWADIDGDGWSDLVFANYSQPNRIFLNHGGRLALDPVWSSQENDPSNGLAVCDVEGDGDLDVLVVNEDAPTRLYLNVNHVPNTSADWSSLDVGAGFAGVCGDMERDGDLDIGVAYLDPSIENGGQQSGPPTALYRNLRFDRRQMGTIPRIFLARPGGADANGFSTAQILEGPTVPVSYTLRDMGAARVALEFSRMGGGLWEPAVSATLTQTLALGPGSHGYDWDLFRSGVMGTLNAVSLRLTAYPDLRPHPDGVAGSYEYGAYATSSYPFRVRGTTVRVLRSDRPVLPAASGAMIYTLAAGQDGGGLPMAPTPGGPPSLTDAQGYLQGEGELKPGDRILALAPISATQAYSLYYTNGRPTEGGVDSWTINQSGTQVITVGPEHPLLLFNLTLALEWDASRDLRYMQRLRTEIQQTSRHLYDFTDGQIALGAVTIYQNGEQRDYADVVIHSTNRLRPFASEGGVVLTPTIDPILPAITYYTGQVHIGADWSRYGDAGQGVDQDWSLVLAHELSHYLLYLEDTYIGLSAERLLTPIDKCVGSAMGDVYAPDNTEFIADPAVWSKLCGDTLAAQELGRTEWDTLRLWYPALHSPAEVLAGPADMPFAFTTINVVAPAAPLPPIVEPMVYLTYKGGGENSADARAYLIKNNQQVVPLGSPIRAQGEMLARGAVAGDRFCLFDWQRRHYGCETLTTSGQHIELHEDREWTPLIQLSPITTRTNQIHIDRLPPGLDLRARLFPDEGLPTPAITLTQTLDGYDGTLVTDQPSLSGHIQVWAEAAGDDRPEMIIAYSIGGNPGYYRIGGGSVRSGGGYYRIGGAHALSPDGQMLFFTEQEFPLGQFYALQQMAQIPELPGGKRVAGQGYRVVASPGTQIISGSVTFQYRGEDVLIAGLSEESLRIAYWNGAYWEMLKTVKNTTYNMASAAGRGPGIYALLGGRSTPAIDGVAPTLLTNDLTATIELSGTGLLAPAWLALIESSASYTVPVELVSSSSARVTLPRGLPAGRYQALVINGDLEEAPAPAIGIYPPSQDCFAEQFDSGLGKWAMQGPWAVTARADGMRVLDDSPGQPYGQAVSPSPLLTSTITLLPSIDLAACPGAVLTLDHDYVFAQGDHGRVELSLDDGASWRTIADFSGAAHERPRSLGSDEWRVANLRPVQISLGNYQSGKIQLRFSLVADQRYADRGWIMDRVTIRSGGAPLVYIPLITR